MSAQRRDFVEGSTIQWDGELRDDGVAINAAGLTPPALVMHDKHGRLVTIPAGTVTWISDAAGTIRVLIGNLGGVGRLSPYRVRFKLTDVNERYAYYPDGEHAEFWYFNAE